MGGWIAASIALVASTAQAQDAFEIQVYRADVNQPMHFGLELHSNYVAWGQTTSTPPEIPTQGVWHETLEPSFGLTRWWELGGYLQFADAPGRGLQFGGVKLRSKFRLPLPERFPLQFGLNLEVSYVPAEFEANVWGSEIRPIITWHPGALDLALNPIIDIDLAGPYAGIPQFQPCAAALYELAHTIALGLEYYSAYGPMSHWQPWPRSAQYLYVVASVIRWEHWEMNGGVGFGLTDASNHIVIKCILGHEF